MSVLRTNGPLFFFCFFCFFFCFFFFVVVFFVVVLFSFFFPQSGKASDEYTQSECVARKPLFRISDQVPHKLALYSLGKRLEACNFRFKKKRDCTICVAKTKLLISCAVTAQLISSFVFG